MSVSIDLYYFADFDRSARVRWLLLELGLPFNQHAMEFGSTNQNADYLQKSPFGLVPMMVIDAVPVFESGAILQVLLERFPNENLLPSAHKEAVYAWTWYAIATLENVFAQVRLNPQNEGAMAKMLQHLQTLESRLSDQDYIACAQFSVADIPLAHVLNIALQKKALVNFPALQAYVARNAERPAAKEAKLFSTPFPF